MQRTRPVANLRVIENVARAFGHDREEQVTLPLLEKGLTIHARIDIHQPGAVCERLSSLPYPIHRDDPCVRAGFHDCAGKYILSPFKTLSRGKLFAGTRLRAPGHPYPGT